MKTATFLEENCFVSFGKLLVPPPPKQKRPSQHIFFTNNSVIYQDWHTVSIFFRSLLFVIILHTNCHIQSNQRYIQPPYCIFCKGWEQVFTEAQSNRESRQDTGSSPSLTFRDCGLCSSRNEVVLSHWKPNPDKLLVSVVVHS